MDKNFPGPQANLPRKVGAFPKRRKEMPEARIGPMVSRRC